MAAIHDAPPEISFDDPERHALTQRSTWVSVVVNVFLTAAQVVVGFVANSQGLIADGLHSLSDLVCDFLVLFAAHHSKDPADDSHPYGHARIETAASFALGVILAATGAGIIWGAANNLQNLGNLPPVQTLALWTAGLALVCKEGLFRYMLHVGERVRSPMLIANAWHARSDAASSLVVAVGIVGNLLGYNFADSIAAVIVGFMIVRMGVVFSWEAVQELIDTGLSGEEVANIRQVIIDTPGVSSLHELRTRKMAHRSLVDAHICVDPRISVSEGHRIAEMTRKRVLDSQSSVADVLVHVDV
ncbi:MAG TPA: cation diffusion facilitator family transporter, partial [Accumulibacter sp.]|nr:cation diffusion facilitator family transporter [Accumulibacter sp.]